MILTPAQRSKGTGSDITEDISENTENNIYEDLTRGQYFLHKIGLNEQQMKNKITEINNIEQKIIDMEKEEIKEIMGERKTKEGRKDFQMFQSAVKAGKKKIDKKTKGDNIIELLESPEHSLELFYKPNDEEQFSLISFTYRFLFRKLIEIRDDLSKRLGEDTYALMRQNKITLGKIGPKALEFLLSNKLSTENIIKIFWKLKEKSKQKYNGKINYGFIEGSMVRIRKEELDEKIIDKIKITEIADDKTKEILKKTYLYKVFFPHFCNHASGSFQDSLSGMPEKFRETNRKTNNGNPTGFFITNANNSQLFYFKIDQEKKSTLDLKNNQLGGINDFDNLLMRQISQAIKIQLQKEKREGGEKNQFNYSALKKEEIVEVQEQFKDYCVIEIKRGCMVITIINGDINFEPTDREQSGWLLDNDKSKNEQETIELLKKDFEEAKKIIGNITIM